MTRSKSAVDEKKELSLQLEFLRRSLAESEEDWLARGFFGVRNPVAENIKRDIAAKEAMLKGSGSSQT